MKKLGVLVLLGLALLMASCASSEKIVGNDAAKMDHIYRVDGYTKDQLFTLMNAWIAERFAIAGDSVINYSEKEDGKIVGEYVYEVEGTKPGFLWIPKKYVYRVHQTLNITTADEKVRVKFTFPQKADVIREKHGVRHWSDKYEINTQEEYDRAVGNWAQFFTEIEEFLNDEKDWTKY